MFQLIINIVIKYRKSLSHPCHGIRDDLMPAAGFFILSLFHPGKVYNWLLRLKNPAFGHFSLHLRLFRE